MQYDLQSLVGFKQIKQQSVVSPKGELLGYIADIVLEPSSGKIQYLALITPTTSGYPDKFYALPWEALSYQEVVESYVFPFTLSKLLSFPDFNPAFWPTAPEPAICDHLAKLSNQDTLEADPNQNASNREALHQIMHEAPAKTASEIFVETDQEGFNQNPSEQHAYPGLQKH